MLQRRGPKRRQQATTLLLLLLLLSTSWPASLLCFLPVFCLVFLPFSSFLPPLSSPAAPLARRTAKNCHKTPKVNELVRPGANCSAQHQGRAQAHHVGPAFAPPSAATGRPMVSQWSGRLAHAQAALWERERRGWRAAVRARANCAARPTGWLTGGPVRLLSSGHWPRTGLACCLAASEGELRCRRRRIQSEGDSPTQSGRSLHSAVCWPSGPRGPISAARCNMASRRAAWGAYGARGPPDSNIVQPPDDKPRPTCGRIYWPQAARVQCAATQTVARAACSLGSFALLVRSPFSSLSSLAIALSRAKCKCKRE